MKYLKTLITCAMLALFTTSALAAAPSQAQTPDLDAVELMDAFQSFDIQLEGGEEAAEGFVDHMSSADAAEYEPSADWTCKAVIYTVCKTMPGGTNQHCYKASKWICPKK